MIRNCAEETKIKLLQTCPLKYVCEQILAVMDEANIPLDKLRFTKDILDPMIADKRVTIKINGITYSPGGPVGREQLRHFAGKLKLHVTRAISHFEQTCKLLSGFCDKEDEEEVCYLIDSIIQDNKKYAVHVEGS